jgi:hypothetical protein
VRRTPRKSGSGSLHPALFRFFVRSLSHGFVFRPPKQVHRQTDRQGGRETFPNNKRVAGMLILEFTSTECGEMSRVAQVVQCLATRWTTGRSRFDPRQRQQIFPLTSVSRPVLGPTQPPVQWVPRVLSLELKRGRGVTLTAHRHLVKRLRMSKSYTSSPPKRLHGV